MPTCREAQCHPDAECFENKFGTPECKCRPGFRGDGLQCTPENTGATRHRSDRNDQNFQLKYDPVGETCNIAHNCSPFATCKFNDRSGSYRCVCVPGYQGDGYSCDSPAGYRYIDPSAPSPDCEQDDSCRCPDGFLYSREVHRCLVDGTRENNHHNTESPDHSESDERNVNIY
jgi:nidogen (entactin)